MKGSSLISVIIPVYNGERYLAEAVQSVLAQSYQPTEIIVVDDGSTDGSSEVAKRFASRVRYSSQPHSGPGAARNRGIDMAGGDFFAFLDADDLWPRDKLHQQKRAFDADSSLDIVSGHIRHFFSPELDEETTKKLRCPTGAAPGFLAGAMMIRSEAFFRVGPFETNWKAGECIAWYARGRERGLKTLMLPEVVLFRRIHISNLGLRERQSQINYVRILKASLDRRRRKELAEKDIRADLHGEKAKKESVS